MSDISMNSPQAKEMKSVIASMLARFGYGTDNGEVLAEYVTVMIINNKTLATVNSELGELIGGDYDPAFGQSLFQALGKIGPVPAAQPVGAASLVTQQQASAPVVFAGPAQSTSKETDEEDRGHRTEPRRNGTQPRSPRREGLRHPVGSARIFTNAMDGALRDAATANNSETVDELRRYLESDGQQPNDAMQITTNQQGGNTRLLRERNIKGAAVELGKRSSSQTPPAPSANRPRKAPVLSRLGDRMNPYSRPPQQNAGSVTSAGSRQPEPRWNMPAGMPALPMTPFFPPMTPEMAMSLGLQMPPGFPIGMRPHGMMPMDSTFTVQLGPMRVERGPGRRTNFGVHGRSLSGDNNVVLTGAKVRCREWPNCPSGKICRYFHPTKICPRYPNCPNDGNTCTFIHPDTNSEEARKCHENGGVYPDPKIMDGMQRSGAQQEPQMFAPMAGPISQWTSPQAAAAAMAVAAGFPGRMMDTIGGVTPCKFGANCTKPNCHFQHPSTPSAPVCRFHPNCRNIPCAFSHPGRPGRSGVDKPYGSPLAAPAPSEDTDMAEASAGFHMTASADTKPSVQELLDRPLQDAPPKKHVLPSLYKNPIPCREGGACKRPGCYFTHPWDKSSNIPCRFGGACTRTGCIYQHPRHQILSVVFNKPGQNTPMEFSHLSERGFSLPGVEETILPGKTANGAQLDPANMAQTTSSGGT